MAQEVATEGGDAGKGSNRRRGSSKNTNKKSAGAGHPEVAGEKGSEQKPPGEGEKVLGVFVHYSDCLSPDYSHLLHPVVKVLVVDLSSGDFVAKREPDKAVTCYGEAGVRHILPLMTQPFAFRHSRTLVPRWEELLLFNESFSYLSCQERQQQHRQRKGQQHPQAQPAPALQREKLGLFFLVQDFVSMSRTNNSISSGGSTTQGNGGDGKGWHDVAWAFLKPFPSPGVANTETKLRLQLFKPNQRKGATRGAGDLDSEARTIWGWWMNHKHVKYPSSLYVTVQAVDPPRPDRLAANLTATIGKESVPGGDKGEGEDDALVKALEAPRVPTWTRAPGQACQIPKTKVAELEGAGMGVSCLRFSRDGRHLAVGCPVGGAAGGIPSASSAIYVYDVANSFAKLMTFGGHSGPIYDLDWHDHRTLLSASGDGTAQIWHLGRGKRDVLEHPTFVYCSRFHPDTALVVVTGSYDRVVRVWKKGGGEEAYAVMQELTAHNAGFVTSLEFDSDGHNLFSGDKAGKIKVWEVFGGNTSEQFEKKPDSLWFRLKRGLAVSELEGYAVDSLRVHPGGRRLLVQSASPVSPLVMVDLKLATVMQEYRVDRAPGGTGARGGGGRKVGNCVTPCGEYVFAGGRGGAVHVWRTDDGAQAHVFQDPTGAGSEKGESATVHAIAFHPHDHIVVFGALGALGTSQSGGGKKGPPVAVLKYSRNPEEVVSHPPVGGRNWEVEMELAIRSDLSGT